MAHKFKSGVIAGDQVQELFKFAKANKFALPAVNVTSTSTVNAVIECAAELNSPVVIQFSQKSTRFQKPNLQSNVCLKMAHAQ